MNLLTKTGEGGAEVNCTFNVDSDGDVIDLEVGFKGVDIFNALSESQVEALESQCFKHYMDEAKQSNTDAAIERHLSNLELP